MHTLVTPTLEKKPMNIAWKKGEEWRIKLEQQSIFWPRVTDQAGEKPKVFVFEWSTQDAPRIRSHLLFVKNKEVGRAEVMEALVEYYENELNEGRVPEDRLARRGASQLCALRGISPEARASTPFIGSWARGADTARLQMTPKEMSNFLLWTG